MKYIDDIPFYTVMFGVILNIVIGLITGVGFTALMLRSIVATILFTIIGFMLSYAIKIAAESINYNKLQEKLNQDAGSKSTFDVTLPATDDSAFYDFEEDDEFKEIDPASLQSISRDEPLE